MRKLDLVAWLADGHLYHLELQSSNDAEMAKRMLDYYLLLWKRYGVVPVQHVIEEETVHMPVIIDPMENRVIKRYFLQGKEEGRVEGKQEGARTEAAGLLTRLLERRFGRLPKAVSRKLNTADLVTLEDWSLRLLDAATLEEVLRSN